MQKYKINNRRYTGSKYKLIGWIKKAIKKYCKDSDSFFDVFGGTGVVTAGVMDLFKELTINDFLYSNEIIYKAFFDQVDYDEDKISQIAKEYNTIESSRIENNYMSENFGDKYFSMEDAKKIGYIRQDIEELNDKGLINEKEYCILLSSLLYSFDKIANTVGHYEAYRKNTKIQSSFTYTLIDPLKTDKTINIFRCDSNQLVRTITADVCYIDPPYNSRQYSRFYHVLETVVHWDNRELYGVALKPKEENMSEYCRNSATRTFEDLIMNLKCKYILVSYNNTYDSKSTSSQNKIKLEDIYGILKQRGVVHKLSKNYNAFSTGKTDLHNHKEYLFVCEVDR